MRPHLAAGFGLVAAAAKHDQRNNDDPAAAVVIAKKATKAVVIHTKSSFKPFGDGFFPSLDIIV